jgi:hypothetical protein
MTGGLLDAALAYAQRGWPVFPCKPGQKVPNTEHGFKDATTDRAAISGWWSAHPDDNVAIATGSPGPDVLDVDVKAGVNGYAALNKLRRAGLLTGAALLVRTPSGGLHLYFAGTSQPCGRLPEHGLDFKALGGYVLAPPSVIGDRRYELDDERIVYVTHSWPASCRLLRPAPRPAVMGPRSDTIEHLAAWVGRLAEGNRNNGLYWAACRAIETGSDPEPLVTASALDEAEARQTVASAARRVAG